MTKGFVEIPFTGVEELLFFLDTPGEPQNQRLEIELPSTLDVDRLSAAVDRVIERNELLRVRLRPWRSWDRGLFWIVDESAADDPIVYRRFDDRTELEDARDELLSRPFALVRSPPFRLGVLEHAGRTHLLLVVHHTAVDGQALVTIMRELAASYAGRPIPPDDRRVPAAVSSHTSASLGQRAAALGRIAAGALRRTARVASDGAEPSAPGCHLGGVRLDRERTNALDPKRLLEQATTTDLLLAAGVMAIDRWNDGHGERGGRISFIHALGLPTMEGRPPLSNSWMALQIGATQRQRSDPRRLIRWVASQRRKQLEDAQAARLRAAISGGLPFPLWAKRAVAMVHPMTGHRLVETGGLTNMGRVEPYDFGEGIRSDALWIDSVVRVPRAVFLGCTFHDGILHVSLRSIRAQLGRDALQRLGDLYLETLEELG